MHPAWAARSDLPRPLGPQAPPPSPPLPSLGHLGPQLGALTLESPPPPPPPTPHLPPPPPPKSPPLRLRSSLSEAQRPRLPPPASGPSPRFCPRPPPASPAASAAPGLAPRASCGGGGAERRQAQPGRWGQRHTQRRGGSERGDVEGGTEPGQRWTGDARARQSAAGSRRRERRGQARVIPGRPCTEHPLPQPSSHLAEGITLAGPRSPDSS